MRWTPRAYRLAKFLKAVGFIALLLSPFIITGLIWPNSLN